MAFSATYIGQVNEETVRIDVSGSTELVIQITGFTESTTGETSSKYFVKEFALSSDNILFTSFRPLSVTNIGRIKFRQFGPVYLKLRYTREGSSTVGTVAFNSISITTITIDDEYIIGEITNKSAFKSLVSYNLIVQELAMNLLEKIIIGNGILPKFVERNIDAVDIPTLFYSATGEDEDFIIIWKSVCDFLAIINTFCESFQQIYYNKELLLIFLRSKGLYFCGGESLVDLQYIATNYFKEYSKRGTMLIFKKKGDILDDTTIMPVKGELLRLICNNNADEFLFSFDSNHWIIDKSGPLYRGNSDVNMNKEQSDDANMAEIENYWTFGIIERTLVSGIYMFVITNDADINTPTGFGTFGFPLDGSPTTSLINVDVNLSYIISFWLKSDDDNSDLFFGIDCFDIDDNLLPSATADYTGSSKAFFIERSSIPKETDTGTYYLVRGILYAKNTDGGDMVSEVDLNWNSPNDLNLRFDDESIKKICINIGGYAKTTASSSISICNLKMFPLKTEYSRFFIQNKNFMDFFLKNNNKVLSTQQIEQIMRNELLPISVNFKNNYL